MRLATVLLSLTLLTSPAVSPRNTNAPVGLQAAAPGVLAALVETDFLPQTRDSDTWPSPALQLAPAQWRVNGVPPRAVHRYSLPADGLPARGWSHDVKVRHHVYLDLGQPLRDGQRYRVQSPYGGLTLHHSDTLTPCEAIKVNQAGYHPGLHQRFANFGVFLGDGGTRDYPAAPRFRVWHAASGALVSEGSSRFLADDRWRGDAVDGERYRSGEMVYRLDLGGVPPGGPYFISVPGCGRSASFSIGGSAARDMARLALRGIYHQRCGLALTAAHTRHTRGLCAASHRQVADTRQPFPATAGNAQGWIAAQGSESRRTVVGGWHDAGDFDRRAAHLPPLTWWLSYFEARREHAPWREDGWLQIPESGNGVPDALDEAMWALRAWEALQIADPADPDYGAVLAGTEASGHPGYGEVSAASDELRYGTYAVDARVTAWSAGAFAQMARLWQPYDRERTRQLLGAAESAWTWLNTRGPEESRAATAYAALQLYLTTGLETYHAVFRRMWSELSTGALPWPEQCVPQNATAQCQMAPFAMYFHPRFRHLADPAVRQAGLDRLADVATGTGYHCDLPQREPAEPYPQCLRAWGNWGRQVTSALRADYWVWAWLLLDRHPDRQRWFEASALVSQFATGLNPLNRSFYTGLGSAAPVSSTHLDSYFTRFGRDDGSGPHGHQRPIGQVPGLLIFGPGDERGPAHWERAVTDKLHPGWDALPRQRRWGDGWSAIGQNEVLTQNMAYQALLYTFLASVSGPCTGPSDRSPASCAGRSRPACRGSGSCASASARSGMAGAWGPSGRTR